MITVVRKPFVSEGRQYEPGDIVESTYWRNEQGMMRGSGHLRPASEDEIQRFRAGVKNIRDVAPATPATRPSAARKTSAPKRQPRARKAQPADAAATP